MFKRMRPRTGSVRQTIMADGPNGVIFWRSSKWNPDTLSMEITWTPDITKAKVWRYPGNASEVLRSLRPATVQLTGARLCNARQIEGWVEK